MADREKRLQVHFSSRSDEWATPQELFDRLDAVYRFTLGPTVTKENAKCERFYARREDGLAQDWSGERVFCNPPYGREIAAWVGKMARCEAELVVGLLPARTDTRWFHEHILGKAEIHFLKGRARFGIGRNPAPFPSMLCVWR